MESLKLLLLGFCPSNPGLSNGCVLNQWFLSNSSFCSILSIWNSLSSFLIRCNSCSSTDLCAASTAITPPDAPLFLNTLLHRLANKILLGDIYLSKIKTAFPIFSVNNNVDLQLGLIQRGSWPWKSWRRGTRQNCQNLLENCSKLKNIWSRFLQ